MICAWEEQRAGTVLGIEASVLPEPIEQPELGRGLTLLLAVATGLSVCNMYWAQPLLATLAHEFRTSTGRTGLLVTMSQLGYAAGLVLLVPLGDLLNRRVMVTTLLVVAAAAQAAGAGAQSLGVLMVASAVAGMASVVAQVFVPWSAALAAPERRGRVVGTVMSGLLLGILLARTMAGLIADVWGWRIVYLTGAAIGVVLAAVLAVFLPHDPARPHARYTVLLCSVWALVPRLPLLRVRALYGALVFAMFSVFWTTVSYLLAGEPYRYSETTIGLFGLIGAAGALAANVAGRASDRGFTRAATGLTIGGGLVSFGLLAAGRTELAALIAGVVLLDVAVQGTHILNQGAVYTLGDHIRSRLTSVYMTSYFAGGSLGSAAGAMAYEHGGWFGACALGALIGAMGFAVWLWERHLT